ncbi:MULTISPECIES: hypothetical protein [Amycolatopsis]|uniref:hypothetical protein n=1 Tax=Amycolatopsis TaxID=1813 RepID=UPI000B8B5039|nr:MULTISPECIES: hypothetical protein [Amycolatopsis]OXM73071.1 hypothetical protein CF166_11145 [Amycolatopsis sp. KNN50.9b]
MAEDRAYWQDRACAPDCIGHHEDGDHPDDRACQSSWEDRVTLTCFEPTVRYFGESKVVDPAEVLVFFRREWREAEPCVFVEPELLRPDLPRLRLTLAEADRMGRALRTAVRRAKGGA